MVLQFKTPFGGFAHTVFHIETGVKAPPTYTDRVGKIGRITLKFFDIMIGVVLGLGFQWWPNLVEPWQYAAFIFVYVDLVDYWIDYSSALRRFPPKRELGIMLDVAIIFTMFLYIYSTQLSIFEFLLCFMAFKIVDVLGLLRTRFEHRPTGRDRLFVHTWILTNLIDIVFAVALYLIAGYVLSAPLILAAFVTIRIATRILSSYRYREVYFI